MIWAGGPTSICYTSSTPAQILEESGCLNTDPQLFGSRKDGSPLMLQVIDDIEAEDSLCSFDPPGFLQVSEVEMRGSEDVVPGTVLQRLIQELRYGNPNENMNLLAIQQQATGSAGPSNSTASTLSSSTENLVLEDPQMVQHSARQEPQGQEHQGDNSVMEKQSRGSQPQQNNEELPTYEEAKAQSQFFRGQQQQQQQQQQQPPSNTVGPNFYTSGNSCAKSRTEGRPTLARANSGQAHKDEVLKELKQGHVRSLSERIMQLSLERNGAKQQPPVLGRGKGFKAGGPSSSQAASKGLDQRGPPPDYPFKSKQAVSPFGKTQELGLFFNDQHSGIIQESMTPSYAAPQTTRSDTTIVRYQPPPEYGLPSRQCQSFPSISSQQQHSPMSSQASSLSGPLHSTSLPPLSMATASQSLPATPPSQQQQQLAPDAFTIVQRAQQMVEMLSEDNEALQKELEGYYEKADKLEKFELEIQKISEAYEDLVKTTTKRESLDKAMRNKLEGEIRRLHDFNRDLRDRLETANRQLACREFDEEKATEGLYASQNKEYLKEKEKLETELASMRLTNEEQRRHIEILDQALNSAQAKVIKLEEELRKKQAHVEKVEKLQQALTQLQAAYEKREQMEHRLRTRLERELESLRLQQRQGNYQASPLPEYNVPALMELVREKEERILALEADMTKWEQKYLEESAIRHFTMNAAATTATEKEALATNHSRNGSYSESSLDVVRLWQEEEEILQANRRCQDMEYTIKNLHAKIIEKDAMIKVLQQRSRRDPGKTDAVSLRPARSVPSIAAATTGTHSRQTSLSSNQMAEEKKEEKTWKGSIGLLLGKDPSDHLPAPSLPPPPLPSLLSSTSSWPVAICHMKMGSKDSSTQTDKGSELFWPSTASFPGRGKFGSTPGGSPALRHAGSKGTGERLENSPSHGKLPENKGRVSSLLHKPEFPDPDMMEVLI
ncbi:angiomotin-like protein 1 isoform X2 [Anolis carolinensis]|uniref:Angiomotin like 1 n=1 Tax=Anolis carolinensis TaxID=28377 RepID=A0A803T240_ANOCA|nr:PREDICTED: angiomotin-like protein 1 isoform X2 [Anolis carolinensis]|eukprot:XP_008106289.1 PREDICTED: angiomotin-like protein 1 isoform X2 [Anolis carolinensis]